MLQEDFDKQLAEIRAQGERMIEAGEKLAKDISNIKVSRTSSDGAVTIDLNTDGSLDKVGLGHRANDLGHTKLAALINQTFGAARLEYARQAESVVDATFGDNPETRAAILTPVAAVLAAAEEEEASAKLGGRWAPVEPEAEPEAVQRKRKPAAPKPGPRGPRGPVDNNDYGEDRPW